MKIRVLPDSVANQIAAGEVVGSPSSVVKELTENAIDAGASLVTVNFRADGRELVQVIDNGCGMTPADARLAFDKHATSKITSLDDLYELQTFGFRGEALPSIAAVAEVELTTRTEDDELATRIVINGGEYQSQEMVVAPKGSNFKVCNLFYNVPARRKFLESSERESNKIKNEFRRVALCHPEVAFMLYKDDAPIYNLPVANLRSRIAAVMGRHITAQLLEVSTSTTIVKIEGYVGRPEAAKRRNAEQYLFVNGRFFKSPYLHKAVMAAYEKLIPAGVTPSYFLYLTVDTQKVDVNVHPQKTEVKFSEDSEIWQIVNAAVREALAKTGAVPMMDFEDEGEVDIPVFDGSRERGFEEPRTTLNPFYNPFEVEDKEPRERVEWGGRTMGSAGSVGGCRGGLSDRVEDYPSAPESEIEREYESSIMEFIERGEGVVEQELELEQRPEVFKGVLPIAGGYVATTLGGKLAIVDLARAREVLLYNRYMMMLGCGSSVSQSLMFPERMVFSQDDVQTLAENYDYFTSFGFDFSVVDSNSVDFMAFPSEVDHSAVEDIIYDMLDALRDGVDVSERARKERLARILSRTRGVKPLTTGEMEAVLESLEGCQGMSLTPDGRAVVRVLDLTEIKAMV
ncbi:MAG: DNA mismatch repair endonuclease MutL [Tidjanibacter sp.]|nr:DNA mismatch repair endonuclease MutL [Tidjanibacter sp.]